MKKLSLVSLVFLASSMGMAAGPQNSHCVYPSNRAGVKPFSVNARTQNRPEQRKDQEAGSAQIEEDIVTESQNSVKLDTKKK